AQGIVDYDITVREVSLSSENGDAWFLQVRGNNVGVLGIPMRQPQPHQTVTPWPADKIDLGYTVAGLFAEVDQDLQAVEQPRGWVKGLPMVYRIQFDPDLGYPRQLSGACQEPSPSTPVCPSDTSVD